MLSLASWLYSDIRSSCCQSVHALPGIILLYLAKLFYTEGVFKWDIITFVMFMHCFKSRSFDSYNASYPGRSWSEYTSVSAHSSINYTTCIEFLILKQEMHYIAS